MARSRKRSNSERGQKGDIIVQNVICSLNGKLVFMQPIIKIVECFTLIHVLL